MKFRPFQNDLSNKIIEYVVSEGRLGNEITAMMSRQSGDGETLVFRKDNTIEKLGSVGFFTGIHSVYEAKFSSGFTSRGTLEHRYLTNKGWKTLQELKDNLKKPRWKRFKIKIEFKSREWEGTEIGDLALLLGYMWGDGSNRPIQSPKFTNNSILYLNEFRDLVERNFKDVSIKKYSKFNGWDYLVTGSTRHSTTFRIWCNEFVYNLDYLKTLNKLSLCRFFNRLFACDGWITYQGLGYGSKCLEELQMFRMFFLRMGIHSWIKTWPNKRFFSLIISHTNSICKFFNKIGLIFGKEESCLKLLGSCKKRNKWLRSEDWVKLRTVKYLGKKETYDQTVEPEGFYNAEGLIVHNSGKTETVACTVLALGTFYILFMWEDFDCGLFAPVQSMITHVTRNRLRKRWKSVKKWLRQEGIVQTAGEGVTSSIFILNCKTSNKEAFIQSLSAGESADIIGPTFRFMVIEQSELINPVKLKNDVFPMGAEAGGVRVLTGTSSPYLKNDYFRKAIERWHPDPKKNKSTSDYVRIVPWTEASKSSYKYKRYVEREREKLGANSIEFKTQYGLEWVGLKVKFITWDSLALLEKDYIPDKERLRFVGIDVAKAGDSTVVTVIEIDGTQIHIIAWLELEGINYEDQVDIIIEWLEDYLPIRYLLIDIVTLGQPVYDMLKRKLYPLQIRSDGFYGSAKSNSEMFTAMDREFVHGRVHYLKTTKQKREKNRFLEQALDLERTYTGNFLKLHHPKQKGRHDDYMYSLALAIFAFKEKSFRGGVVSVDI